MSIFPGNYILTIILSLAHGLTLDSTALWLDQKPLENLMLKCPKTGDLIRVGNLSCGFIAISTNLGCMRGCMNRRAATTKTINRLTARGKVD